MEIVPLFKSMWRSRTGPILVVAQVALTLAVIVNVAYIVVNRLTVVNEPTGIDIPNVFWVTVTPQDKDYNYAAAVQAEVLDMLRADPTLSDVRVRIVIEPKDPGKA